MNRRFRAISVGLALLLPLAVNGQDDDLATIIEDAGNERQDSAESPSDLETIAPFVVDETGTQPYLVDPNGIAFPGRLQKSLWGDYCAESWNYSRSGGSLLVQEILGCTIPDLILKPG